MTTITIIVGIVIYVGLMWLLLAVMRLEKTPQDEEENGAEAERNVARIVEATGPAPLETDRPHMRAGSAWGQQ